MTIKHIAIPAIAAMLALGAPVLSFGAAPQGMQGDIAMIVGAKTSVDNVTASELRKIVMGDRQYWSPGQRIVLLIRAPQARERDVLLKRIYRMSESQFRQYWVGKVFRADAPAGPKVVHSNQTALELVANLPGAVAFVDAGEVPKGARTVKIDGRLPGEKGCLLQ
ncbi:MAG: hypothetical protein ACKO5K_03800 [Armatimonadota bacterium]